MQSFAYIILFFPLVFTTLPENFGEFLSSSSSNFRHLSGVIGSRYRISLYIRFGTSKVALSWEVHD